MGRREGVEVVKLLGTFYFPPKAISLLQHFIFGPKSTFEGAGRPSKASSVKRKLSYLVKFEFPGF